MANIILLLALASNIATLFLKPEVDWWLWLNGAVIGSILMGFADEYLHRKKDQLIDDQGETVVRQSDLIARLMKERRQGR